MPFFNNDICGMVHALQLDDNPSMCYIPVPLTSVHMDIRVVNFTAMVEVNQEFVNKENNPIECVYFFPVEEEAAVTSFTAELEGRTIKTVVKEKEEARDDYNKAVKNHQTAFLLEETKPDIFEIKVGYLSPGAGCKISITYITELPVEDGKIRLTVPTTVAPRYTPPSDQSEESKKIASIQHDFQSSVKMTMNMEILMKTEIISVKSPSHSLSSLTREKNKEYYQADCQLDGKSTDMDKDIVILIDTEEPNNPKVFIEKSESGSHMAMVSFVPQFKLKEHQVEAVFLVDCSGSMRGNSMEMAKEALQVFLHSLPVNSFFNIITFGSSFHSMFPASTIYDDDSLAEAKAFVSKMSADLGGTEIYKPLEHIFKLDIQTVGETKIPRQIFILTDGQVSNSFACIQLVKKNSNNNRVFCLGVGSSADRHLVKGMARAGQGTATFTTEGEPITAKVINQLKNGLQPCITNIKINWGDSDDKDEDMEPEIETKKTLFGFGKPKKNVIQTTAVKNKAPRFIPAIYDGSRLLVYKLLDKNISIDSVTIKVSSPEGQLDLTIPVDEESSIEGDSVHKLYARKMIQDIEESHGQDDEAEKKKNITEVGLKYQLPSQYTSFVGIDEKQNKLDGFVVTRHVKNQLSHNSGHRYKAFGMQPMMMMARGPPPGAAPGSALGMGMRSMEQGPPPGAMFCMSAKSTKLTKQSAARTATDGHKKSKESFNMPDNEECFSVSGDLRGGHHNEKKRNDKRVLSITSCQSAHGSFHPTDILTAAIGCTLVKVQEMEIPQDIQKDVWMTIVVVTFLRKICGDQQDIWQLVVEKAERWLKSCGTQLNDGIIEKAREFVMSFCNQTQLS